MCLIATAWQMISNWRGRSYPGLQNVQIVSRQAITALWDKLKCLGFYCVIYYPHQTFLCFYFMSFFFIPVSLRFPFQEEPSKDFVVSHQIVCHYNHLTAQWINCNRAWNGHCMWNLQLPKPSVTDAECNPLQNSTGGFTVRGKALFVVWVLLYFDWNLW